MKFSYNWLKELVNFKDSPKELAEFLTLRVFEVESVEKRGRDWALDIKVLPNRISDASGHLGMAKEISSLKHIAIEPPEIKLRESKTKKAEEAISVTITSPEDCLRYIARVIDHVKISHSPAWLKKRLEVLGLQPINNIVDAANLIMLETGQPLHVFDYEKINGHKIVVRRAKKEESLLALDEKNYTLNPDVIVIADDKKPMAVAGIKGGKESGITSSTKKIVLESANFDPTTIRKASRMLNLKTDASYRFEHGLDPNLAESAIDRLTSVIVKLAGGEILAGRQDAYPEKIIPRHVALRTEYANRLIGAKFPAILYEVALKRLGFNYQKRRAGEYHIEVPTVRRDIEREEDIVEEIIRVWGYEKIISEKPMVPIASKNVSDELMWEWRIKDFFVGAGFTEAFRYIFTGDNQLKNFGLSSKNLIEIENPLTPEQRFLAHTQLPSYIMAAKENEGYENLMRLFAVTKSFSRGKGNLVAGIEEEKRLVVVWSEKSAGEDLFFKLKGVIDELFDSLGLSEHGYSDSNNSKSLLQIMPFLHPYRVAGIQVDNEKIGVIGELHPAVKDNLKIKHNLVVAELDMEKIITLAEKESEYMPISRYPSIIRDIAVIVPEEEKTERVTDIIENTGGKLLTDSDLFDYFQDEAMDKGGKKSLAFHLVFQSVERTLTDQEVNVIFNKIVRALEGKRWVVRD